MIEHLGEGHPLPGQGHRSGQLGLVALEVFEQGEGPFRRMKTCCHTCVSAILGLDRRVQVDVGIR